MDEALTRRLLDGHGPEVDRSIERREMVVGLLHHDRKDLERLRDAGETLAINAVGLVVFAPDVTPELVEATISHIKVYGALRAAPEVKALLRQRDA